MFWESPEKNDDKNIALPVIEAPVSLLLRIKFFHVSKNTVCRKIDWGIFVQGLFYTPYASLYGGLVPGDAARPFILEL